MTGSIVGMQVRKERVAGIDRFELGVETPGRYQIQVDAFTGTTEMPNPNVSGHQSSWWYLISQPPMDWDGNRC